MADMFRMWQVKDANLGRFICFTYFVPKIAKKGNTLSKNVNEK